MKNNLLHPIRNKKTEGPAFPTGPSLRHPHQTVCLKEYGRITLRPIEVEDEPHMVHFHEKLSEESIYLRYFEHMSLDTRTLHERLAWVCRNTEDSLAIVAERPAVSHRAPEIIAVGRLTTTDISGVASFAMLMNETAQRSELPSLLLKRLMVIAHADGFHTLSGELLVVDHDALTLCRSLGFTLQTVLEDGIVCVSHAL